LPFVWLLDALANIVSIKLSLVLLSVKVAAVNILQVERVRLPDSEDIGIPNRPAI